jgi:hypothetical protein
MHSEQASTEFTILTDLPPQFSDKGFNGEVLALNCSNCANLTSDPPPGVTIAEIDKQISSSWGHPDYQVEILS